MEKVLIVFQKESSGLHIERPKYPIVGRNERKPVGKALLGNQIDQSGGGAWV